MAIAVIQVESAAIEELPEGYRTVFLMHDVEGYTHQQIGSALGLAGGVTSARLLSAFLYGVSVSDSTILIVTPLLLMAVALLACWAPARQATRIDPMVALRTE